MNELNEPQLNPLITSLRLDKKMGGKRLSILQTFIFAFQGTVIAYHFDNSLPY